MKLITAVKYILVIVAIVLVFVDWKLALGVFFLASIFRAIPLGPNTLLNAIAGCSIIGGAVYLFIDWRIGLLFILIGFLVIQFRAWAHRKNIAYYNKQQGAE